MCVAQIDRQYRPCSFITTLYPILHVQVDITGLDMPTCMLSNQGLFLFSALPVELTLVLDRSSCSFASSPSFFYTCHMRWILYTVSIGNTPPTRQDRQNESFRDNRKSKSRRKPRASVAHKEADRATKIAPGQRKSHARYGHHPW